jgi:hypothetical protein
MDKDSLFNNTILFTSAILGVFSFIIFLSCHNIADGDLWARLAQGASIWNTGHLIHKDVFAFTPVLPQYIDHEWGAGLAFFSALKFFGPESLLWIKILIAIGALLSAAATARLNGARWGTILLLAIPAAFCVFPAYIPVIRSHAFTFLFFSAVIFCLEKIRKGAHWPAAIIPLIILLWVNIHGGFISGLGIIAIYTAFSAGNQKLFRTMVFLLVVSAAVTFINPYGIRFWGYLIPALTMKRPNIGEWAPMSLLGLGPYLGFRIIAVIFIAALFFGWKSAKDRLPLYASVILIITLILAMRHRRHAPFFGLSCLIFIGPYIESSFEKMRLNPKPFFIIITYAVIALAAAYFALPAVNFKVLAPAGFYPVREADILMYSKSEGNAVVPLRWGNYIMWRLYPRVKISMCGRYETIYPESTCEMNYDFYHKKGKLWDRIIRSYPVDYVFVEKGNTALDSVDLKNLGFNMVWQDGYSALYASDKHARELGYAVVHLPPITIQPLDAAIPDSWGMKR